MSDPSTQNEFSPIGLIWFVSFWRVAVVRQWTVKGLVCDQERMSSFSLGATKMGRLLA